MKCLVGETPMEPGQTVKIRFSDGKILNAVYTDTFGYNHSFTYDTDKTIILSNHFMRLKGISVTAVESAD